MRVQEAAAAVAEAARLEEAAKQAEGAARVAVERAATMTAQLTLARKKEAVLVSSLAAVKAEQEKWDAASGHVAEEDRRISAAIARLQAAVHAARVNAGTAAKPAYRTVPAATTAASNAGHAPRTLPSGLGVGLEDSDWDDAALVAAVEATERRRRWSRG